jgi:hypothetical protein
VVISRDRRPSTSALRNVQPDVTGGLGHVNQWATARQVAHAATVEWMPLLARRRGMLGPRRWSPAAVRLRFGTPVWQNF